MPPNKRPDTHENVPNKRQRTDENDMDSNTTDEEISETTSDSDSESLENDVKKLEKTNPELYNSLKEVKAEIERTEPNVKEMLLTPMRLEDRAQLCHYYEIYKTQVPNTSEWLAARKHYNMKLKKYKATYEEYKKYSDEEISYMKKEEEKYTTYDAHLSLKFKILSLETTDTNKRIIYNKYEELLQLDHGDDEYGKLKNWLIWATTIPYDKIKIIKTQTDHTSFIREAKDILDKELYGMKKVKEQILLFLSAKLQNPAMIHSNLGLVGLPGVGKTKIAKLIGCIMGLGFAQISFGGVEKADFLKGHDYTYVGAQPGQIIKCLKQIGHKNGIILLDELEKTAENPNIRSALLHLIDPTQNNDFRDLFLSELSIDISNIWWIASMNSIPKDEALADRLWIIEVDGYDHQSKIKIIEDYVLPRTMRNYRMVENSISFSDNAASYMINRICKTEDKGVRTLEKTVKDLVNKINFLVLHQNDDGKLPFDTSFNLKYKLSYPVIITKDLLDKLLVTKELDNMVKMMYL